MIDLQWPYALALLPLPWLLRSLLASVDHTSGAVKLPFFARVQTLQNNIDHTASAPWVAPLMLWLTWLALLVAIARPVWIGEAVSVPLDKRDMMLAVDISLSMQEEDMLIDQRYVSRIAAVKSVVSGFVANRQADRLGLILFGERAYMQTPLTFDRTTVEQQLLSAQLGFAGNATAIGDAIGIAIKRLRDRPAESRVLVLLTDGANTAGTDPLDAAKIAAQAGIRIHTIGIGASVKTTRDLFGRVRQVNPSADLDEGTLRTVALRTGGAYFRAENPADLRAVYSQLDELEPTPQAQYFRPITSLLHWPLSLSLFASSVLALTVLGLGRRRQALTD